MGPLIVSVGHVFMMLRPVWLTAGCVSGTIAFVNNPPVAIDPVPLAGHRALATPPRQYELNSTPGIPRAVVREQSPLRSSAVAQISCWPRVVRDRYRAGAAQKNVGFLTIGPPMPPPYS